MFMQVRLPHGDSSVAIPVSRLAAGPVMSMSTRWRESRRIAKATGDLALHKDHSISNVVRALDAFCSIAKIHSSRFCLQEK